MGKKINCLFCRDKKFMGLDSEAVYEGKQNVNSHLIGEQAVFELTQQFGGDARSGGGLFNGKSPFNAQGADVAAHGLNLPAVLFTN